MQFFLAHQSEEDWERLRHGVADALEGAPTEEPLSFSGVQEAIRKGEMLWTVVAEDNEIFADIVSHVTIEDGRHVMNFPIMFGKEMHRWIEQASAEFTKYARHNNCTRMRLCTFKPAIARMYARSPVFGHWNHIHLFETEV